MKPILYPSTETAFDSNGLGVLSDAASCIVKEERNGSFELEMQYPIMGLHYSDIGYRAIILAKPNPTGEAQPFRIYRITRPMGGLVTAYAQHISYDLSGVAVSPFAANSLAEALQALSDNAIPGDSGFSYWTDKSSGAKISSAAPLSVRSILGGVQGGILDVYGGEFEFDRFKVKLWTSRGDDRGVTIRYGKNLTTLEQDANCAEVYTDVYPYWTNGEVTVELPEKTVSVVGTFDFVRVLPLDLSSAFDAQPSADDLRASAQYYILDNNIGVPKVSLTVGFEQLAGDDVRLCDTVTVVFSKLGVGTKAKVISTTYDTLQERFTAVEIGDVRTSIADTIAAQAANIQRMPTSADMQKAIVSATAWITGGGGGYLVAKRNAEGQFSELLIMDTPELTPTTKLWRWNSGGLGFSADGGQTYKTAITQDGAIVANFITTGEINAVNVKIKNLDADNIIYGTLKGPRLADGAVTNSKLGEYAVAGGNIATNAIINRHITSGSIATTTCNREINGYFQDIIAANKIFVGEAKASYIIAGKLNAFVLQVNSTEATWMDASSATRVLGR